MVIRRTALKLISFLPFVPMSKAEYAEYEREAMLAWQEYRDAGGTLPRHGDPHPSSPPIEATHIQPGQET